MVFSKSRSCKMAPAISPAARSGSGASSAGSSFTDPIRLVLDTLRNSVKSKSSRNSYKTNTINSSNYVDFCTDPTVGMGSGEFLAPPAAGCVPSPICPPSTSKHMAAGSSSRRTSTSSISPTRILSTSITAAERTHTAGNTTTNHLTGNGIDKSRIRVWPYNSSSTGLGAMSTTLKSIPLSSANLDRTLIVNQNLAPAAQLRQNHLKPWEWPRITKPRKHYTIESEDEYKSNQLFYHRDQRQQQNKQKQFQLRSSKNSKRFPAASCIDMPPSSSSAASFYSASSSSSASASTSSGSSHSTEFHEPSCLVHNNPSSNTIYYRYGSGIGFGLQRNLQFKHQQYQNDGFCCKTFKGANNKDRVHRIFNIKRHNLRTFQLICTLLCALGIATLLVISIISTSIRSPANILAPATYSTYNGNDLLDTERDTSILNIRDVYNTDHFLHSNHALFFHNANHLEEQSAVPNVAEELSIRQQLKTWLFRNVSDPMLGLPLSSKALEESKSTLLNISHFKFILNNPTICTAGGLSNTSSSNSSTSAPNSNLQPEIYFMILVHSAPTNFHQRQAIRGTWGSVKSIQNKAIRLVFLLGQFPTPPTIAPDHVRFNQPNHLHSLQRSIAAESQLYGDIVQGNFHDVYHNLVYKHLMGYKWVQQFCYGGGSNIDVQDRANVVVGNKIEPGGTVVGQAKLQSPLGGQGYIQPPPGGPEEVIHIVRTTGNSFPGEARPESSGRRPRSLTDRIAIQETPATSHNGPTFILKTDDDVFIDIFQLFEFTTKTYGQHPSNTLICNVYDGTSPIRLHNTTSSNPGLRKWVVSLEEYPLDQYPKYCGGLAYLITPDLITRILEAHEKVMLDLKQAGRQLLFWIDDVYVTGVLRELIGREPYYLNLRYAYDTKLYQPWLTAAENSEDTLALSNNSVNPNLLLKSSRYLIDSAASVAESRKIPYMIVHLEHKNILTEEMHSLWRKTMRVWKQH